MDQSVKTADLLLGWERMLSCSSEVETQPESKWRWLTTDLAKSALLRTDGTEDKAFLNAQKTRHTDTYCDNHAFIVMDNKVECDFVGFVQYQT